MRSRSRSCCSSATPSPPDTRARGRRRSPDGVAAASRATWSLASGADAVRGVVAAEDDSSVLCDRELRTCNGHNRVNDRPLGAPASAASNRLSRGRWVRSRRRCTQIADSAAAIVVSVPKVRTREPGLRRHRVLAWGQMTLRIRPVIAHCPVDSQIRDCRDAPQSAEIAPVRVLVMHPRDRGGATFCQRRSRSALGLGSLVEVIARKPPRPQMPVDRCPQWLWNLRGAPARRQENSRSGFRPGRELF
jgi:hypothetical protein